VSLIDVAMPADKHTRFLLNRRNYYKITNYVKKTMEKVIIDTWICLHAGISRVPVDINT